MDFFFFKQKTAYEMRISDWSSDVCSSDHSVRIRLVTQVTTEGGSIGLGSDDLAAVAEKLSIGAGSYRALIFIVTNAASRGQIVDDLVRGFAIDRFLFQRAIVEVIGSSSSKERVCQ